MKRASTANTVLEKGKPRTVLSRGDEGDSGGRGEPSRQYMRTDYRSFGGRLKADYDMFSVHTCQQGYLVATRREIKEYIPIQSFPTPHKHKSEGTRKQNWRTWTEDESLLLMTRPPLLFASDYFAGYLVHQALFQAHTTSASILVLWATNWYEDISRTFSPCVIFLMWSWTFCCSHSWLWRRPAMLIRGGKYEVQRSDVGGRS